VSQLYISLPKPKITKDHVSLIPKIGKASPKILKIYQWPPDDNERLQQMFAWENISLHKEIKPSCSLLCSKCAINKSWHVESLYILFAPLIPFAHYIEGLACLQHGIKSTWQRAVSRSCHIIITIYYMLRVDIKVIMIWIKSIQSAKDYCIISPEMINCYFTGWIDIQESSLTQSCMFAIWY